MSNILEVVSVDKSFNHKKVIDQISFDIREGEIFALIGPNGAGKTTTIKMITGLLKPDSGSIEINGHSIVNHPIKAKEAFAYIPDEPFVFGNLTGLEILEFTAKLYQIKESNLEHRFRQLLDIYQLHDIANILFDQYSRGNKQKFSILAALIHHPNLLIFDEPIVGLDPESIIKTKQLMLKEKEKGRAILISTHTLSYAEQIADRIGFISNGKLVLVDTLDNLKKNTAKTQLDDIYLSIINSYA